MASPRKRSREGIVSRVVYFVIVIGVVSGVFQYVTGGVKVGDDGWFRAGQNTISELFDRGSETATRNLEDITDGAGSQAGEHIRDKFSRTTDPERAPAPESASE